MHTTGHDTLNGNVRTESDNTLEKLHERLCQGDDTALAEVFSLCRARLCRIVEFRMDQRLRPRLDPEDVLQETFLAARKRLDHYRGSSYTSPFLWFRAILSQTLVDLHRRYVDAQMRAPDREVRIDAPPFGQRTSTSLAVRLVGNATSPDEAVARADMMEMMETAIAGMDSIDQEVIALRHFEQLSNRETADVLSITQKAASIRYVRAIRRLKTVLESMTRFFSTGR